jgi:hypothetical protein
MSYYGSGAQSYPNLREIPVDEFIVAGGLNAMVPGEGYDNISLKTEDKSIPFRKVIEGNMLRIIPDRRLDYDTAYVLFMPANAFSGLQHHQIYKTTASGDIEDENIRFVTESLIEVSYLLGTDIPFSVSERVPLRLDIKARTPDVRLVSAEIHSGDFANALFYYEEHGRISELIKKKATSPARISVDFNGINLRAWPIMSQGRDQAFRLPYHQYMTAAVTLTYQGMEKTVKVPVNVKADSLYSIFVIERGTTQAGPNTGRPKLGDDYLPLKEPFKVLNCAELLHLPWRSKLALRFIDGTAGLIYAETAEAMATTPIYLNSLKIEPLAAKAGFKYNSQWSVTISRAKKGATGVAQDTAVDSSLNFILKKSPLTGPIGFMVSLLGDPDKAGGEVLKARLRSEIGFTFNTLTEELDFVNFSGQPELVLENDSTVAVSEKSLVKIKNYNQEAESPTKVEANHLLGQLQTDLGSHIKETAASSFIYKAPNGLIIESFSSYWWNQEKLEALFEELMKNRHGSEMDSLAKIKIYPDKGPYAEAGRIGGYYSFNEKTIYLNFGDDQNTVESMADTLSHEYGHHFTFSVLPKAEGYYISQSPISASRYYGIRQLYDYPYATNSYVHGHAWHVSELLAEDYVQLLGSPTALAIRQEYNRLQENNSLPEAKKVSGLRDYFFNLTPLTVPVYIQDKLLLADVEAQIINGRTMVPMRAIFESLGAEISWDGASKTVTATKGQDVIKLTIGQKSLEKNGQVQALDVPAQLLSDRTMVPVRFVATALGYKVSYDDVNRIVYIK